MAYMANPIALAYENVSISSFTTSFVGLCAIEILKCHANDTPTRFSFFHIKSLQYFSPSSSSKIENRILHSHFYYLHTQYHVTLGSQDIFQFY